MGSYFRVASGLLLSTGLFNLARGPVSSRDHEVSSDSPLESVRGKIEQPQPQPRTRNRKDPTSASEDTTTRLLADGAIYADLERGNKDLPSGRRPALAANSRELQEWACDGNSSTIYATSTVYPLLEGCLTLIESNSSVVYYSSTARVGFVKSASIGNHAVTEEQNWIALYAYSEDVWLRACTSAEYANEVGASEATWNCTGDTSVDLYVDTVVDEDEYLSISCGCPTPSPLPITAAPTPGSTGACGESNSFSIASETLPGAEGCFLDTAEAINGEAMYTTSGTLDEQQARMIAVDVTGEDDSTAVVWALVNAVSTSPDDFNQIYCLSVVDAAFFHPSEVPYWNCGGESTFSDAALTITAECGCSSTSPTVAPSPVPSPTPWPIELTRYPVASPLVPLSTASPTASPTSAPPPSQDGARSTATTCTGDGSFRITSNLAPDLDGCFVDIEPLETNEAVAYTVSGTSNTAEIAVTLIETFIGTLYWRIAYMPFGAASEQDERTYCISTEPATEVNPGDASWDCDFIGEGDNVSKATEEDISIVCGACTVTGDASTAANLVVGIAAGGTVMVAAASAFGAW